MPDSRPRIVFDEQGVCNACHTAAKKESIDWASRRKEFLDYVERFRPKSGPYDCVVPWSGGKDSSAIAYKLKFEFGLNPLLVTFSPLLPNEIGAANREELLKLGFDHIMVRPNQKVARQLAHRFFVERGNPKVAWDAGINAAPLQIAVKHEIPLVFYAEHGESEYGGRILNEESTKMRDFTEVIEHQIGDHPSNWVDADIGEADLAPYLYPDQGDVDRDGVKALYFGYFFRWSMLENYRFIKSVMPSFRTDPKGRTDGTFTDFDSLDDRMDNLYYYMQYIKFGFGRATRDACRLIQNGQMSREDGLELALKYDAEFPSNYFEDNLDYLSLERQQFSDIVDHHRNAEIWTLKDDKWLLRYPPR